MPRAIAAAFAVSLGFVSFAALAEDASTQQQGQIPQQTAQNPAAPNAAPQEFNANTVPAVSELRDGNGSPLDPRTGLPDSRWAEHDGF